MYDEILCSVYRVNNMILYTRLWMLPCLPVPCRRNSPPWKQWQGSGRIADRALYHLWNHHHCWIELLVLCLCMPGTTILPLGLAAEVAWGRTCDGPCHTDHRGWSCPHAGPRDMSRRPSWRCCWAHASPPASKLPAQSRATRDWETLTEQVLWLAQVGESVIETSSKMCNSMCAGMKNAIILCYSIPKLICMHF